MEALAIVLLINGVQITTPQPAILWGGAAWVPAKAVCTRVGAEVALESPGGLKLVAGDRVCRLPLARTVADLSHNPVALLIRGTAYVQAKVLAALFKGRCAWSPATRTLALTVPWLGPPVEAAGAAQIVADPLSWYGRPVTLTGRHLGMAARPAAAADSPAVTFPEPAFVLEAGERLEYTAPAGPRPALVGPFSALGTCVRVRGTVALSQDATPLLENATAEVVLGRGQGSLRVEFDRGLCDTRTSAVLTVTQPAVVVQRGGAEPPGPGPSRLELISPDGTPQSLSGLAVERSDRDAVPGTRSWRIIPGKAASKSARSGVGRWEARCVAAPQTPGAAATVTAAEPGAQEQTHPTP